MHSLSLSSLHSPFRHSVIAPSKLIRASSSPLHRYLASRHHVRVRPDKTIDNNINNTNTTATSINPVSAYEQNASSKVLRPSCRPHRSSRTLRTKLSATQAYKTRRIERLPRAAHHIPYEARGSVSLCTVRRGRPKQCAHTHTSITVRNLRHIRNISSRSTQSQRNTVVAVGIRTTVSRRHAMQNGTRVVDRVSSRETSSKDSLT